MLEFDEDDIEEIVEQVLARRELQSKEEIAKTLEEYIHENTPEMLMRVLSVFEKKYRFRAGQLIKWKPRCRDRDFPLEDTPAVFLRYLEEPVVEIDVRQGLITEVDSVIGRLSSDGLWTETPAKSQLFQPFYESESEE